MVKPGEGIRDAEDALRLEALSHDPNELAEFYVLGVEGLAHSEEEIRDKHPKLFHEVGGTATSSQVQI